MPDLGNKLREKRIALGYSLDDIQEKTKIQKRYLEAIEDGDFSRLPGSFYVRAFIRQYAESLGMNADELLTEVAPSRRMVVEVAEEKENKEHTQPGLSRIRNERERLNDKYSKIIDLAPKVLLILSILGIAFCVWKFSPLFKSDKPNNPTQNQQDDTPQMNVNEDLEPPTDDVNNPEEEEPPKTNDNDIVEPPEELESTLSVVGTEGNVTTYELKGTNKFELKLVSNGVSYVDIKDSTGKMIYAGEVSEGDALSYDFSQDNTVQLNIGRSTDIVVYVNDEEVPYEIAPTDAVHQKMNINFVSSES